MTLSRLNQIHASCISGNLENNAIIPYLFLSTLPDFPTHTHVPSHKLSLQYVPLMAGVPRWRVSLFTYVQKPQLPGGGPAARWAIYYRAAFRFGGTYGKFDHLHFSTEFPWEPITGAGPLGLPLAPRVRPLHLESTEKFPYIKYEEADLKYNDEGYVQEDLSLVDQLSIANEEVEETGFTNTLGGPTKFRVPLAHYKDCLRKELEMRANTPPAVQKLDF